MPSVLEVIEANLLHGRIVYEEAKAAGYSMTLNEEGRLDIADACAMVDHESMGGQNIFGCDSGGIFCNEHVTADRVQKLLRHIDNGGASNGIGLTQITYPPLIYEAEEMGGAHWPYIQCKVGFSLLYQMVEHLGYTYGIAAYNAGEGNAQLGIDNGYFGKIMVKREKWKELFATSDVEGYEARIFVTDATGWLVDKESGLYLAGPANADSELAMQGPWPYVQQLPIEPDGPPPPGPEEEWQWPSDLYAPLYDGNYVHEHPSRWDTMWRYDVEEVARYLVNEYNVSCNTYVDHPEGYWRDPDSIDVWGPGGRGDPIDYYTGQAVFDDIFNNGLPPWIDWVIWQSWMWTASGGWSWFSDDTSYVDMSHTRHSHWTFI
jgi:hypothetical protein